MAKFRQKIIIIEAIQFTKDNIDECFEFCPILKLSDNRDVIIIPNKLGEQVCSVGDYVTKGCFGEFHVIEKRDFENIYELIEF